MVEGHTMAFWYVFAAILSLIALIGIIGLIAMFVADTSDLKSWVKQRQNKL